MEIVACRILEKILGGIAVEVPGESPKGVLEGIQEGLSGGIVEEALARIVEGIP